MTLAVRALVASAVVILLPAWTHPLLAQPADEQMKQQEEQDRLYLERLLERQKEQAAEKIVASPDDRRASAAELLALADRIIQDTSYASRTTDHYVLKTDDPRLDAATAASLLESFRTWFDGFWSGRLPLRPYAEPSRAYLFYSFNKYNQILTGNPRFGEFRPNGHYTPIEDVIVLHTDSVPPGDLPEVLVHEAAHQLVTNELYGVERSPSLWVSEGLAGYFGMTLRDAKEGFQVGSIGRKGVSLAREGERSSGAGPRFQLDAAKKILGAAREGSLERLIRTTDRAVFYGPGIAQNESAAWLLVHYLFHGDGGAHAEAFVQYLKQEIAGAGGADVFYATVGVAPDELQARWVAYGKKLKAR